MKAILCNQNKTAFKFCDPICKSLTAMTVLCCIRGPLTVSIANA